MPDCFRGFLRREIFAMKVLGKCTESAGHGPSSSRQARRPSQLLGHYRLWASAKYLPSLARRYIVGWRSFRMAM